MQKRVTIKDIAKTLGIHHSTVSRALRDDPLVRQDTKNQIIALAKKLGYKVNHTALEFRGGKNNKLAIIVPNINHQFFSNVVSHFTDCVSKKGYVASIFQTNENVNREKEIVENIIQYNFAGVIASISMESKNTSHFKKLIDQNIQLVMFDRVSEELDVPKVVINNVNILYKTIQILVDKEYKRITYISGPKNFSVYGERQKGYKLAIRKNNLEFENQITIENGFTNSNVSKLLDELINKKPRTDAIICESSVLAKDLLKEMFSRKIKIPEEIAIIVFGENPMMDLIDPPISTIIQPTQQIAENIMELLEKKILNPNSKNVTLQLSAELRIKGSV